MTYDAASARTKLPVPIWVDSLIRDTLCLSPEQFGAWHLIIYAMWSNKALTLPDDDSALSTITRMHKLRWTRKIRPVLEPMFEVRGGTWTNQRLAREAHYIESYLFKQHASGVHGGRPAATDTRQEPLHSFDAPEIDKTFR